MLQAFCGVKQCPEYSKNPPIATWCLQTCTVGLKFWPLIPPYTCISTCWILGTRKVLIWKTNCTVLNAKKKPWNNSYLSDNYLNKFFKQENTKPIWSSNNPIRHYIPLTPIWKSPGSCRWVCTVLLRTKFGVCVTNLFSTLTAHLFTVIFLLYVFLSLVR